MLLIVSRKIDALNWAAAFLNLVTPMAATVPATYDVTMWVVYTVAGAFLASAMALMLKTTHDRPVTVIGRSIGGLLFGVLGSRVTALICPDIVQWSHDPILLGGLGVAYGLLGYTVSYPLVNFLDKRSPDLVKALVDRAIRIWTAATSRSKNRTPSHDRDTTN